MTLRFYRRFFIFIFIAFVADFAFAVEGFQHDLTEFPTSMRSMANRVFMVYSRSKQQPRGTAFLVHNDGEKALFLTARHVLVPDKPKDLKFALNDLSLHANGRWQNGVKADFSSDKTIIPSELGAINGGPKELDSEKLFNDVGYFVTDSDPSLPLVELGTLGESVKNMFDADLASKKHFIIGYPVIYRVDEMGSKFASVQLSLSRGDFMYAST